MERWPQKYVTDTFSTTETIIKVKIDVQLTKLACRQGCFECKHCICEYGEAVFETGTQSNCLQYSEMERTDFKNILKTYKITIAQIQETQKAVYGAIDANVNGRHV